MVFGPQFRAFQQRTPIGCFPCGNCHLKRKLLLVAIIISKCFCRYYRTALFLVACFQFTVPKFENLSIYPSTRMTRVLGNVVLENLRALFFMTNILTAVSKRRIRNIKLTFEWKMLNKLKLQNVSHWIFAQNLRPNPSLLQVRSWTPIKFC